jgi:branched-chain amino acid transport system substrate-binding protein
MLLLAAIAVALAACSTATTSSRLDPAPAGTLRIVSSLPAKGIYRQSTAAMRRAIDMAVATLAPGTPVKIEHIALDGGSDETGEWSSGIEERNARAAADDPSVIAYIGPYNSGAAAVTLPFTNRAGLITLGASATWPGLTQPGWDNGEPDKYYQWGTRNFLSLAAPDSYQAIAAAEWTEAEGRGRVLVLEDGSTYSAGMARTFVASLPRVASGPVGVNTEGENIQLPTLEQYDAVFIAPSSVRSASRLARALESRALPVYATDVALGPQFLEYAGSAARTWLIVSNGAAPPAPALATLYPDTPNEVARSRPALISYILTRFVVEAVEAGETDRAAVLEHVRSKRIAGSRTLFDDAGNPTTWHMTGYRVADGAFAAVREFSR